MNGVKIKTSYFFSQPHQSFFLFGVVWAVASMMLFALGYRGITAFEIPPLLFHSYSMVFIIFTQFFVGFVFTTFPRFCQSAVIDKRNYLLIFAFAQSGALLFCAGTLWSQTVAILGMVLLFAAFIFIFVILLTIYLSGITSRSTSDPFWILVGFGIGVVSHLLFLMDALGGFHLYPIAIQSGFWLYIIFTAFVIAQRMVPFFSHVDVQKQKNFSAIVFVGLFLKSLFALSTLIWAEMTINVLLSLFIFREFIRWKLPLFQSPAILWILHLALFWIPAALVLGASSHLIGELGDIVFSALELHLIAIGFLTTILIGFGTRVTLGHSGQVPYADRYTVRLFWFTQIVVLMRVFYSLSIPGGILWFDLSLTAWVILFVVWSWRYGSVLLWGKKLNTQD